MAVIIYPIPYTHGLMEPTIARKRDLSILNTLIPFNVIHWLCTRWVWNVLFKNCLVKSGHEFLKQLGLTWIVSLSARTVHRLPCSSSGTSCILPCQILLLRLLHPPLLLLPLQCLYFYSCPGSSTSFSSHYAFELRIEKKTGNFYKKSR